MMSGRTELRRQTKSIGDRAVDGLLAGFVAGGTMLAVLVLLGGSGGLTPAQIAGQFDAGSNSALTGALLHLATGGIYGMLFAALSRFFSPVRRRVWFAAGTSYGLLLWLLARGLVLPLSASPLLELPSLVFLAGHLVYGVVLGGWLAEEQPAAVEG